VIETEVLVKAAQRALDSVFFQITVFQIGAVLSLAALCAAISMLDRLTHFYA
jgi:hypothetical protein